MSDQEGQSRKPDEMGGSFEFQTGIEARDGHFAGSGDGSLTVVYTIRLPHQCEQWVIAESTDKDLAIAQAEVFIREANAALDKLREA